MPDPLCPACRCAMLRTAPEPADYVDCDWGVGVQRFVIGYELRAGWECPECNAWVEDECQYEGED